MLGERRYVIKQILYALSMQVFFTSRMLQTVHQSLNSIQGLQLQLRGFNVLLKNFLSVCYYIHVWLHCDCQGEQFKGSFNFKKK